LNAWSDTGWFATAGIVIGLGAIAFVLMALGRRGDSRDFGSVSRVWITEHQAAQRDDRG
jgi:hypothetical protein